MKICFFGLGSIGQRHLKNLKQVLNEEELKSEIHAYRSNKKSEKALNVDKEIFSLEELDSDYDIIFITNPTSLHFSTLKNVIEKTKHIFLEKPLFDNINCDLNEINMRDGVYYVAAPLRYTGIIKKIKDIIKNKSIYSIRAICSSYLPDWRPNQNYKEVYSARKELGGGVSIDLIHEWDYLVELFGFPKEVYNFQGTYSHLEINSEDLSIYIAKYEDKLLELHLDYFGRVPKREIEIYMDEDILVGDFIKKEIRYNKSNERITFNNIDMYIEEMRYFIKLVKANQSKNYIPKAYELLKMIKKSEG